MEFLRKLVVQTRTHLKGLTLSQRLAIGSCVALIAIALLWLVDWAARPVLVPLLDQAMSTDQLGQIQQRLSTLGIEHEVAGDLIMVPAESRYRLLAQLGQARLLPDDTSIGFAKLLEESSPWLNMQEQDRRWSLALGGELSRVLREFDGVLDARVFIDKNMRRTIGQPPVVPTASVFVKLAAETALDRKRVNALASFVAHSVSGLDVANVAVTDATTGSSYTVPKPEDGLAFSDLEDRSKKEEYFASKIRTLLGNIPGLLVAVHAELDPESRRITKEEYGKPVQLSDKTETTNEARSTAAAGPGVVPNTAQGTSAASPAESMEKSVGESTYDGKVDATVTSIDTPRNGIKSLSASINVPRSYLAAVCKQANDGKEPTDDDLEKIKESQFSKITEMVGGALSIPSEKVKVAWFPDSVAVATTTTAESGSAGEVMALVRSHWDKAGLGALAVLSLFMMLMMVRRVGEGPVLPGEEPPKPQVIRIRGGRRGGAGAMAAAEMQSMTVSAAPIGEASENEQLLVGREVDEKTVRTQQVVEQVGDMIRDDPTTAANILQRWIESGKQ